MGGSAPEQAAVGVEGALAKPLGSRYPLRGGRAGWVKVRHVDDVDALVLGVTGSPTQPTALVLGQTDRRGQVRAVALSTTLTRPALASLAGRLRLAPGDPVRASGVVAGLFGREDFTYRPVEPRRWWCATIPRRRAGKPRPSHVRHCRMWTLSCSERGCPR
ncbi:hypothetical protein AB0F91_43305 [Amycolatopsis sp. NPDC023774]|uniref:hypothetical protein n=1 Tax=Amycolatopsis sp. NPDC023774 TaxID=3155015 RepID=UPI003401F7B5